MLLFQGLSPRRLFVAVAFALSAHSISSADAPAEAPADRPADSRAGDTRGHKPANDAGYASIHSPVPVSGQTLSLRSAEALALANEPGALALVARADALREQAVAAGALPDPSLRLGLMNYPLESGSFSTEGMTHAQLGLRQSFPPGQTRSLLTKRFEIQAQALDATARRRALEVQHAVRSSWLETWYAERALTTVHQLRPLFMELVEITTSLYSVGYKDQQDVLRAELELSRVDDRLIELQRRRADARARLAQWIADDAAAALPDSMPQWPEPPALEQLRQALNDHPAVEAANADIAATVAGVNLAQQQYKPGWALDVGYAYRDGRLPNGRSRSDFLSVGVTMDLPVFRARRQDRRVAAAVNERRAAKNTRQALLAQLHSELQQNYDRWHDLSRRLQLYRDTILPATHAQAEAALSAYQGDTGDFAEVMRATINELNTQLDYLRIQVDQAQAWVSLARLGGLQR